TIVIVKTVKQGVKQSRGRWHNGSARTTFARGWYRAVLLIKLAGRVQTNLFADHGLLGFGFGLAHGAEHFAGHNEGTDEEAGVDEHHEAVVGGVVPVAGNAEV